jgi:parvulin-like peptidyl-prolyl isomerase
MKKHIGIGMLCLVAVAACGTKDQVISRVGKQKITVTVFEDRLRNAPPPYQSFLDTQAGRKQFLDLIIREKIVLEAAGQSGFINNKDYKKSIKDFEAEQKKRERDYKEGLLMEMFVQDLNEKKIKPSDKDVEAYFNEHKDEFLKPQEIKARHILVASQEEAEKALARIKAGEDFGKVAREVSTDPVSARNGGEIGPFRKGNLVPEFEQAVFALKKGEVSGVVKTQFGFHIIKKIDEKTLPARTLDDSKAEIAKIIEKNRFDAWLEDAKKKYQVTTNYDMLDKIPSVSSQQPQQPEIGNSQIPQPAEGK